MFNKAFLPIFILIFLLFGVNAYSKDFFTTTTNKEKPTYSNFPAPKPGTMLKISYPRPEIMLRDTRARFYWHGPLLKSATRLVIYKEKISSGNIIKNIRINNTKSANIYNLPNNSTIHAVIFGMWNGKEIQLTKPTTYQVSKNAISLNELTRSTTLNTYQRQQGLNFQWPTLESKSNKNHNSKYSIYIGSKRGGNDYYEKHNIYPQYDFDPDRIRPTLSRRSTLILPSSGINNVNLAKKEISHTAFESNLKKKLPINKLFYVTLITWAKNDAGSYYKYYSSSSLKSLSFNGSSIEDFHFTDNSTIGNFRWSYTGSDEIKLEIGTRLNGNDLYEKTFKKINNNITTSTQIRNLYNNGNRIYVKLSSFARGINKTKFYQYGTQKDNSEILRGCSGTYGNQYVGSHKKFFNLKLNSEYSDINNYLMMQAAAKTYPRQIRGSGGTKRKFQCAAEELYNHWGFSKISFYNSTTEIPVNPESLIRYGISSGGTNAIIASNDDVVVITIRGTELNEDILTNVRKFTVPWGTAKAHTGYYSEGERLAATLSIAHAHMHNFHNKKVYITGHSLGGAIAIMTSHHLRKLAYPVTATYTFAAPEVGDSTFTSNLKYFDSPYYATINYQDPIPYINRKPINAAELLLLPIVPARAQLIALALSGEWYAPSLAAAQRTTFFDRNHNAIYFESPNPSYISSDISILNDQQPYALSTRPGSLTKFFMTDQWHFHHSNFYLAFTYKQLLSGSFEQAKGTEIKPEFEATSSESKPMCIKENQIARTKAIHWDTSVPITSGLDNPYEILLSDMQSYPFTSCP